MEIENAVGAENEEDDIPTCWFCGKNDSRDCQCDERAEFEKELYDERERIDRKNVREGVRSALIQRCKCESNWQLGRLERWFHTVKLLVCVLLGLRRDYGKVPGYPDSIEVGQYHYAKLYAGWEAEWIVVGMGVFENWWYELERDGDWEM